MFLPTLLVSEVQTPEEICQTHYSGSQERQDHEPLTESRTTGLRSKLKLIQIGSCIFDALLRTKVHWISYSVLSFGLLSLFVPFYQWIAKPVRNVKFLFRWSYVNQEYVDLKETYETARIRLLTEYDRCNPLTENAAMQEYYDYLQKTVQSDGDLQFIARTAMLKAFQDVSEKLGYYGVVEEHVTDIVALPKEYFAEEEKKELSLASEDVGIKRGTYNYFNMDQVRDVSPFALAVLDLKHNNVDRGYLDKAMNEYQRRYMTPGSRPCYSAMGGIAIDNQSQDQSARINRLRHMPVSFSPGLVRQLNDWSQNHRRPLHAMHNGIQVGTEISHANQKLRERGQSAHVEPPAKLDLSEKMNSLREIATPSPSPPKEDDSPSKPKFGTNLELIFLDSDRNDDKYDL